MKSASKPIRKLVREWCGVAYRRELGTELAKLHNHFHKWEAGTQNEFELIDAIHEFHQGPARDLYVSYEMGPRHGEELLLAAAIARGVIQKSEIPSELHDALEPT